MAYKDINKKREYDKKYFSDPENIKRMKEYENTPEVKERKKSYGKNYYKTHKSELYEKQKIYLIKNKEKHNKSRRDLDLKRKLKVYNHYSNYNIQCNCCGEKELDFLSIDHVNNDGNVHRKTMKYDRLHRWLYKNNFPSGFQILCMNCNMSKHKDRNHICAHKRELVKILGY